MKNRTAYSVQRTALAVVSAALLVLSFPGFNLWILAWMALIPLFFAVDGQRPLKAFLAAYLTGFLFFLGTMYWLIHVTLPGMLVVVAYLALYFGFFGLIVNIFLRMTNDEQRLPAEALAKAGMTNFSLLFVIPAAWVALEWIRAHALTGFGWNFLGYSQSPNLPVIQIADMSGVYGVSFLVVIFNAAIYMFIKNFKRDSDAYIPVAAVVITLLVVFGYGVLRLNNVFTGERLKVALVQGNIPQDQKWDRRFADMILSRYEGLTRKAALEKPDLVIWPEASVPGFVEDEEELSSRVVRLAKDINTPLLVGSPRYEKSAEGASYYNSAFLFLKDGSVGGRYDKVHLVPFGEYVPLKGLFFFVHKFAPRPIGDFAAGKAFTVLKFPMTRMANDNNYRWKLVKNVAFSPLVCFEDIFPDLARQFARGKIDFLVNITNDGWFGHSSAAYQHAQASVFRAVENRINVLRAANTGLSCFIDQKGRINGRVAHGKMDLFVSGFKVSEIILSRTGTVYAVYGDVFAYACMIFAVLSFVIFFKRS